MHARLASCLRWLVPILLLGRGGLAAMADITIDGSQTCQVIDGFGVNANHRSWNNSELQPVLDAMIDQGGMTLFRVIFDKADWEATNDNSDPEVMNWSYYNQVYSSADFQKLWDMSAYLNQRGISNGLVFDFQGNGPAWMGGSPLTAGYEAEWAEMVASAFIYARNTQHLQFTQVGPGNEEDILVQGVDMSSTPYVTALHKLAQLLDTNGMGDLRFDGPDLGYTSTAWLTEMMNDPVVMAKLAHFGLHSYQDNGGGSTGINDFLQQSAYSDRTFWMTEFNVFCNSCEAGTGGDNSWTYASGIARHLLYHLANGASAGLVWEGYDSQYNYYSPGQWSYWGLFAVDDTNAVPKTYTPRKSFYTMAQIAKFVRPGARRVQVNGSASPFQLLAFYHPDLGQLTLTGINPGTSPSVLSGSLTNLPLVASLDLYYTDSTTDLCHSASMPVTNGVFAATVPADCVFTLVGFDPALAEVSVLITNPPEGARYCAPVVIPIQASASTGAGGIRRVAFFSGATNLGEVVAAPYGITWSNVPPGAYVLFAGATNSGGYSAVSPGIRVTVVGPPAQISIAPANASVIPYGTQQFSATAADALGTIITPPPTFDWSVTGGGTISTNGLFSAGESVGGPFSLTVSNNELAGTASVSIAELNLAPAGVGYTWCRMAAPTDNSPQAAAPRINDGDLDTDVPLGPGGEEDAVNAYEAAGILWSTPQCINRVIYKNGAYNSPYDGVFSAGFELQFSPDGATWTNAGAPWGVTPAYTYNSSASANVSFTFTGGIAMVQGVRCVGCVHTAASGTDSWAALATELQAFAGSAQLVVPHIICQPADQTAVGGNTVNLSVTAGGNPCLSYQWRLNGTNLDGAVADTLSLSDVQPEQAGSYSVVATNIAGSVTSAVATLTVWVSPAITLQPANQTALAGSTVNLSVAATGTKPLSYQWLFNGTNLDGAVAETLSLTNVRSEQAGGYSTRIGNAVATTNSAVARLTVVQRPLLVEARTTTQGAFAFALCGDAGRAYTIELSTNLVQWTPLGTISNAVGEADFTDFASSNSSPRFYRARTAY